MPLDPHNTADRTPHRNSVLRELRDMQLIAMDLIRDPETSAAHVAQLMRAHVAAEQQRNVLRMRPAPKPIDVSALHKAKRNGGGSRRPHDGPAPTSAPVVPTDAPKEPGKGTAGSDCDVSPTG